MSALAAALAGPPDPDSAHRGRDACCCLPRRQRTLPLVIAFGSTWVSCWPRARCFTSRRTRCLTSGLKESALYAIGGWRAPFGIVLVVDRLSALMLALNALLALPVLVYSIARSDRLGVYYHPLLQFLLMGLNGAFLTGDVFNLFVFFEILLAASYALLLHGGGHAAREDRAALHRRQPLCLIRFLIGVAMIYSIARHAEHGGYRRQVALAAGWRSRHR